MQWLLQHFSIVQSNHRVDRVLGFFFSRPNWNPPFHPLNRWRVCPLLLWSGGGGTRTCRRGVGGWSLFGRGDRHCGAYSIGINVFCEGNIIHIVEDKKLRIRCGTKKLTTMLVSVTCLLYGGNLTGVDTEFGAANQGEAIATNKSKPGGANQYVCSWSQFLGTDQQTPIRMSYSKKYQYEQVVAVPKGKQRHEM